MFNLQGSEIIVILLLALVILGPEKLPDAARKFAQTYGELKKMGNGFQSELKSVLDEPMREMQETARLVQDSANLQKISDQAAEDSELRQAAKSAETVSRTDVPVTEAALESTDPAFNATVSTGAEQPTAHHASSSGESNPDHDASNHDEPDDGPPVIVNQIAAANARGPIEPVVPKTPAVEADNGTNNADQPEIAADAGADADVTAR